MRRIVDHQRLGMDALEQMRRGDVGQVERRVLPHQDDVVAGKLDPLFLAEREMIALLVAHLKRLHRGEQPVPQQRQPVGGVIAERVLARLRFQEQREGRIAADIDPLDRVHLHRDGQAHGLADL